MEGIWVNEGKNLKYFAERMKKGRDRKDLCPKGYRYFMASATFSSRSTRTALR